MNKNFNDMSDIEKFAKIWQIQLNVEYNNPKKNVRISFKDVGPFCEYLALMFEPDYQGGGSGGMGFDLYNKINNKAIEVKGCCTIQNAKCGDCNAKFNDLFLDHCPDCGSHKLIRVNDSRFGIKASETLRQYKENIFGGFILGHVSMEEHIKLKHTIVIKIDWYKLDFDSDEEIKNIRLEYFENQKTLGKKDTNNLLPNSFDFYKLAPLKIYEHVIEINYDDLNTVPRVIGKKTNYYPRVDGEKIRFYKDEKVIFKNLKTYDPSTNTAEAKDFTLHMPYRNKSLGKERGDTRRNLDKRLKEKVAQ